jgi:hypothetical protein
MAQIHNDLSGAGRLFVKNVIMMVAAAVTMAVQRLSDRQRATPATTVAVTTVLYRAYLCPRPSSRAFLFKNPRTASPRKL